MHIRRIDRREAGSATGVVVVIDVIRAFTVAAYALAGGARRLWLVRTVEEAFALREREPDALLAGEIGGRLIPGFDHNNSPARMASADVRGRTLIQRTGAGTQGAVGADRADRILVCSLVNARATARYAAKLAGAGGTITLMATGLMESPEAIEDTICGDYLRALLCEPDAADRVRDDGVHRLRASGRLNMFGEGETDFPPEDVPAFMAVDRFSFAMEGTRREWQDIPYVEVSRVDCV
jgi:2-phosphosulfolactate phosphatase